MSLKGVHPFYGRLLLLAVLVASIFLFGTSHVKAADVTPAQGIQISPVLIDLNAEKSNAYNLKITVTNVTAGELTLKAAINDFRAKDESGNPSIILDDKDIDPTFSFKSWVTPPANIKLKSKESRVVTVAVNVPQNAEAGGHYGVIRFSGFAPGEENSNVSIAASVGVLILARVNGTIDESLSIKDFYIEKSGKRAGLIETGPFSIVERIENKGNIHVKPAGTVTVKNMFGKTIATAPLNEPAKNILPRSVRRLSQSVNKKWMFGRYTVRLESTYGYGNKVLSSNFSFWVIPYKLIVVVVLTVLVIGFLFRFFMKRHNDKIIKNALDRRR